MKTNLLPNKYVIVVVGPTAVGKTDLCIRLAQYLQTEIISADARQFYQGMAIGTAQPTFSQRQAVRHHLVNCFPVNTIYSAGKFAQEALEIINKVLQERQYVILTGGSGLYIKALCEGLDAIPEVPLEIRHMLNNRWQKEGLTLLQKELNVLDPLCYQSIDIQNPQRVIRALEVCIGTGKPYSNFKMGKKKNIHKDFITITIGLDIDRDLLYKRIDERVDHMLTQGLLEEVMKLYLYKNCNALQTVGYQELFAYMDKKCTLEKAISLIKTNTRRYAKRQLTWFRKQTDISWFMPQNWEDIIKYILALPEII